LAIKILIINSHIRIFIRISEAIEIELTWNIEFAGNIELAWDIEVGIDIGIFLRDDILER